MTGVMPPLIDRENEVIPARAWKWPGGNGEAKPNRCQEGRVRSTIESTSSRASGDSTAPRCGIIPNRHQHFARSVP